MIKATTIGVLKANGESVMLAGISVPVHEQKALYRELATNGGKSSAGDLQEVHLFFTSGRKAKKRAFHDRPKPVKPVAEGFVKSLKDLAAALEISEADLKKLRDENQDTFPGKAEDGYEVEVIKAWADGLKTD